jgi:aminomethyltransferase
MTSTLAQTPLHSWHVSHVGRMVDFAGWSMPVQYSSIVTEHRATRRHVGVFDISHMGRIRIAGPDRVQFLDHLLTRQMSDLTEGCIRYSLLCNESGGILDDVLVYRFDDQPNAHWLLVVNAGNRNKIASWLDQQSHAFNVELEDLTATTAMIAVQGPLAVQVIPRVITAPSGHSFAKLKYYQSQPGTFHNTRVLVSRTGYTGEDGFELILPTDIAVELWNSILDCDPDYAAQAAGLGARDTLRLEAGMPLYGHELTEEINPLQAELHFAVNLKGRNFIGRESLQMIQQETGQPRRVGLKLEGRRVPREGYRVLSDRADVGHVTSGTFSPTLEVPLAMAYVTPQVATEGSKLHVDIRGTSTAARVVKLPFYRRK